MAGLPSVLRRLARRLFGFPFLKRLLGRIEHPLIQKLYPLSSFDRRHPFDKEYGVETSGFLESDKISQDPKLAALINPYGGSQPSIVRRALPALGGMDELAFIDIGCGKGRVTIVATEFPFRSIGGVELSPDLANIARANADIVARKFPARRKIEIYEANAVKFPFPEGKLAVSFFHSFGRELLSELIGNMEQSLTSGATEIFFIYYNPVHADLFDASPAFERWFAEKFPYDPAELGCGPDVDDTVIIWRAGVTERESPHAGRHRGVVITKPLWRAEMK